MYRGQRISTIEELKERLTACWDQLPQRLLARAVGAVPKRLQACVTAHGAWFEHMLGIGMNIGCKDACICSIVCFWVNFYVIKLNLDVVLFAKKSNRYEVLSVHC